MEANKGDKIIISKGAYKGKPAWIHIGKAQTPSCVYVIVEKDGVLEERRLMKTSILVAPKNGPQSPAEEILLRHIDIQAKMVELCKLMAACHVELDHSTDFALYFHNMLRQTVEAQKANPKAKYFSKPELRAGNTQRPREEDKEDKMD